MKGRNLILCLDGTWNSTFSLEKKADGSGIVKPSNVLKLSRALTNTTEDGRQQVVYYTSGVGSTGSFDGVSNWLLKKVDNFLGGAFGAGLETKAQSALTFLSNNYQPTDHLSIFGFSRGAATARVVCNILSWMAVGTHPNGAILKKDDAYYLPHLIREYFKCEGKRSFIEVTKKSDTNKSFNHFSGEVLPLEIDLLGVWDTVLSIGSRLKPKNAPHLNNTKLPNAVKVALHALATDEKRSDFSPSIWKETENHQKLQQRWFAGVHANIGGGYPNDGLANCALDWFVSEAKMHGLEFRDEYLNYYRAYADDTLYDSKSFFYKMADKLRSSNGTRQMSQIDHSATVDYSLIIRMLGDLNYKPQNAIDFLNNLYINDPLALYNLLRSQIAGRSVKNSDRITPKNIEGLFKKSLN
ncbi:DUF2235 domain-containing protein [Paraglaciecola sp.]|uniref:DUF2235 domain-containing protein n=1 Tax=Paraglaciecola sp. TaxID=1920173 RepID=UPI0030F49543